MTISAVATRALVVPLIDMAGLSGVSWACLGAQEIAAASVLPTLHSVFGSRRQSPPIECTP